MSPRKELSDYSVGPDGLQRCWWCGDDEQYEELFVPANGFSENATYRDDYLNQSGDFGYLGMTSVYKSGATNPLINVANTDSDTVISFDIDCTIILFVSKCRCSR